MTTMSELDPINSPWIGLKMNRGRQIRTVVSETRRNDGVVWRLYTRIRQLKRDGSVDTEWDGMPTMTDWRKWAAKAEVIS